MGSSSYPHGNYEVVFNVSQGWVAMKTHSQTH